MSGGATDWLYKKKTSSLYLADQTRKGVKSLFKGPEQPGQPPEPSPVPMPILGREEEEAKKKVRRRAGKTGRRSTILAGKMMKQRNSILKTSLGE